MVNQGGFSHYTACHILTHFNKINPEHGIAARYLKDYNRMTENEFSLKVEEIKQFSFGLDSDANVFPMEPVDYDGTT